MNGEDEEVETLKSTSNLKTEINQKQLPKNSSFILIKTYLGVLIKKGFVDWTWYGSKEQKKLPWRVKIISLLKLMREMETPGEGRAGRDGGWCSCGNPQHTSIRNRVAVGLDYLDVKLMLLEMTEYEEEGAINN